MVFVVKMESAYTYFYLSDTQAEEPVISNDGAHDLTLISRTDNRIDDDVGRVNTFRTGVQLRARKGHLIIITARESLSKHGYTLASTIFVGQNDAREVLVHLIKFREGPDIELPFRAVQMRVIPYPAQHLYKSQSQIVATRQTEMVDSATPNSNLSSGPRTNFMF